MTDKAICRNDGRCEYAIQSGAEGNGHCPAGKCAMPCDTPAAHLTIPGALDWDQLPGPVEIEYPEYSEQGMGCGLEDRGITDRYEAMRYGYDEALDQFARILDGYGQLYTRADTHGVVGTHSADSAHSESAYTAVDMTTAAADGFRDGLAAFSADGNRNVLAEVFFQQGDEPFICAVRGRICVEQLEAAQHDFRENLPDVLEQGDGIYTFDFFYEKGEYDEWGRCEIAPGWGFDFVSFAAFEGGDEEDPTPAADESQIDDIPDFTPGSGNKAKRRIAALAAKAKPESFPCWSCRKPVTMEQRADADGNCPHCAAELDLEDWPNAKTGCAYEVGDWACREGGYLWYAGDGEGWDPEDCTHICPHCRTKDYLEEAKENAESCSSYSNNGSSGTGLDIWASAEKTALTANHPAACKALAEIGPVSALDGDDVVICNTQRVGRDQTAKGGDDE